MNDAFEVTTGTKRVIPCVGCGAEFVDVPGPVHRYMDSSPGCWAAFGEVLAREYSEVRYFRVHRLTVDTYAVQHPGSRSPQSIQSVALHLISLCLIIENQAGLKEGTAALRAHVSNKARFMWLTPFSWVGRITVADIIKAANADEHGELVQSWAETAWAAWIEHHEIVRHCAASAI